jgi:hypothetical protein
MTSLMTAGLFIPSGDVIKTEAVKKLQATAEEEAQDDCENGDEFSDAFECVTPPPSRFQVYGNALLNRNNGERQTICRHLSSATPPPETLLG